MKSGHHLSQDQPSKEYGSIPGLTSQTSFHACLLFQPSTLFHIGNKKRSAASFSQRLFIEVTRLPWYDQGI